MSPVNRYDTPAQYEAVNTYVPIPFEQMAQAAAYRNKKADEQFERVLKLEEYNVAKGLENMMIPGTDKLVNVAEQSGLNAANKFVEDFNTRLSTISDRVGTTDASDPSYTKEVMRLANELNQARSQTGVLGKAEQNATNYRIMQENILKNPDVQSNPWLAQNLISHLRDFESGKISSLDPSVGIEKYEDLSVLTDDLIKGIAGEFKGNMDQVSEDKIRQTALNFLPQSRVGQRISDIGEFYQKEALRGGANPEQAAQVAATKMSEVYNNLVNGAIHKYRSSNYRGSMSGGFGGFDLGDLNPWETPTGNLSGIKVAANESLKLPTEKIVSDAMDQQGGWNLQGVKREGEKTQEEGELWKPGQSQEQVIKDRNNKITSTMAKVGIDPIRMSSDEFVPIYNEAVDALNQQSLFTKSTTEEAAKQNIRLLSNNLSNSNIYVPGAKGFKSGTKNKQKSPRFTDAAESLGLSKEELQSRIKESNSADFVLDGPEAGMFAIEILDGKNTPTKILITGSPELQKASNLAWQTANKFRNLNDSPWEADRDENNIPVYRRVKPVLDPYTRTFVEKIEELRDPENRYKTPSDVPKDSNLWTPVNTNLSNMFSQTLNNLKDTPTIGFNFNWYDAPKPAKGPLNMDPRVFYMMQMLMSNQFRNE